MLSFGCIVCIIEGYSLVEVIQENVAKMNQGKYLRMYNFVVYVYMYIRTYIHRASCKYIDCMACTYVCIVDA